MARIQAKPTDGLCYDPADPKYLDRAGLDKEIDRVFDICTTCRLCFNLCSSFPTLFSGVDERHNDDVRELPRAVKERVIDLCYGCKLCEVRCP
ncbi:MAG: heterodisulfide reductase-related iron-sulfur binding cluster, partial [Candidatus Binataceae bacterium]